MDEQLGRARRSASKLRHLAAHAEADATRPGPAGAALAAPGGLAVWEWRATEGGAGVGPWQRCVAEVAEELEAAAAGLLAAGVPPQRWEPVWPIAERGCRVPAASRPTLPFCCGGTPHRWWLSQQINSALLIGVFCERRETEEEKEDGDRGRRRES